jgi:hypothetical protein
MMTRNAKPSDVELRLETGETILKAANPKVPKGYFYTFAEAGQVARADVVERLIETGKLVPLGDGLFPEDSQTWGLADTLRDS